MFLKLSFLHSRIHDPHAALSSPSSPFGRPPNSQGPWETLTSEIPKRKTDVGPKTSFPASSTGAKEGSEREAYPKTLTLNPKPGLP